MRFSKVCLIFLATSCLFTVCQVEQGTEDRSSHGTDEAEDPSPTSWVEFCCFANDNELFQVLAGEAMCDLTTSQPGNCVDQLIQANDLRNECERSQEGNKVTYSCEINREYMGRVSCVVNSQTTSYMDFPQPITDPPSSVSPPTPKIPTDLPTSVSPPIFNTPTGPQPPSMSPPTTSWPPSGPPNLGGVNPPNDMKGGIAGGAIIVFLFFLLLVFLIIFREQVKQRLVRCCRRRNGAKSLNAHNASGTTEESNGEKSNGHEGIHIDDEHLPQFGPPIPPPRSGSSSEEQDTDTSDTNLDGFLTATQSLQGLRQRRLKATEATEEPDKMDPTDRTHSELQDSDGDPGHEGNIKIFSENAETEKDSFDAGISHYTDSDTKNTSEAAVFAVGSKLYTPGGRAGVTSGERIQNLMSSLDGAEQDPKSIIS